VMVFTESPPPAAVLAGLRARSVAGASAGPAGQVQVMSARQAYLPDGRFDPQRMLDALFQHIEQAADGFAGLRMVGDMTWALAEPAGVERLAWYEAQANRLYMDGRAAGVCIYDRRRFDAYVLRQVAGAHPATVGGTAEAGRVPMLRIRRTTEPYGLRLTGEADLTNRQAVAAVLDALVADQPHPAGPIVVDVGGLRFADVGTATLLIRLALRAPAGVHISGSHGAVDVVLDRLGAAHVPGMRVTRSPAGDRDAATAGGPAR
jgi:hypothetical protein